LTPELYFVTLTAVTSKPNPARDAERRKAILEAALECFLQFGFAKTSLDDIAKRANISRPLIYKKYKNKDAIYVATYDHVYDQLYPRAEQAVRGRGTRHAKLVALHEVLLIEPWEMLAKAPGFGEFYAACERLFPETAFRHEKHRLALTQTVLGDRELAQVFLLSLDGLTLDQPSPAVLRRRLELLADRFV
jgi:TetR/AcrR family transcriptional regulator, transcriptional repressor of aconitase